MTDTLKIVSADGKKIVEVLEDDFGVFSLKQYAVRYDEEEDIRYIVQVTPPPSGKFENHKLAVDEAKRLLSL